MVFGSRVSLIIGVVTMVASMVIGGLLGAVAAYFGGVIDSVIMRLTDQVVREKKLTAVMVTHTLRHAAEYGDRILMMNQGEAVLDRAGAEKQATSMEDILEKFNQISLECGA